MARYEEFPKRPMTQTDDYGIPTSSTSLRDPMDRFGTPGNIDFNAARRHQGPAPYQNDYPRPSKRRAGGNQWNPLNWTRRKKFTVAGIVGFVIILVIVGASVGAKKKEEQEDNAYPSYSPLNYTIADTCQFRILPCLERQLIGETVEGTNFFDNFEYWDTFDPAEGFVHYDNPVDAVNRNLTGYDASSNTAFLRVDNKEEDATTGRHSARVATRTTYDSGLFIFDIQHTPYGCASWPAVWLTDQANWPKNGEIDVAEAFNKGNTGNQMTLHTSKGCTMTDVKRKMTGEALQGNCLNSTNANAGCGVSGEPNTFGAALNDNGGGVYAMELRDAGIRIWFFGRGSIPSDIADGDSPTPHTWGDALADFPSTDCDISNHFKNLSIVANIDVCGQGAGSQKVFTQENSCPGKCTDYAAQNPSAFDNSIWNFNSFKVYKTD